MVTFPPLYGLKERWKRTRVVAGGAPVNLSLTGSRVGMHGDGLLTVASGVCAEDGGDGVVVVNSRVCRTAVNINV